MHVDCLCACACMNCRWCCMCVCCAELLFAAAATLISSINHAYRSRYWHPIIRYTTTTSTTTATMTLNAAVSWSAFKLHLSLSVHGHRRSVRHVSINAGIVLIAVWCRWVHIVVIAYSDMVRTDPPKSDSGPQRFETCGSSGSTNFCDICTKF